MTAVTRGMRAPFLAIGGNNMYSMMYDANFTYDSSMPIYEERSHINTVTIESYPPLLFGQNYSGTPTHAMVVSILHSFLNSIPLSTKRA